MFMRVRFIKTSDWDFEEVLSFKSWKELINFMRKTYDRWVVLFEEGRTLDGKEYDLTIEMYDDWRE